ncbi:type 4a pilus biogenesis protein PilO [bacterium]|nr:type 4a pilus biogenesis protein PilO [bacterium]
MNNFAAVVMFIVIALAAALGAFYIYYWQPAQDQRAEIEKSIANLKVKQNQIANLDGEISKIQEDIAKKEEEKNKLAMESNQLNTVVPKLLESTEVVANKFNVKFNDIRISPLVRAEQWSELPIEISLSGTFSDVGNFLLIMEKRKIVNLAAGAITISVSAETDVKSKSPYITVNLSAKVYIMGGF